MNRRDMMKQVESSRYGGRLSVRCVVSVLVAGLSCSTVHAQLKEKALAALPSKTAARPVSVADLAKARFQRVPGKAYGGASFDTGGSGSWYEHYVSSPTVDHEGKIYRMWFVGGARTKDAGVPYGFYERIGLATSSDGINWQIANDGKPVLDLGPPGSPDAKGLAHPYALRVGEKFLMWYGAIDGQRAADLGLSPGHVRVERICLATSSDGIHWKRENKGKPVLDIGPKGSSDSIQATGMHVLKIGGRFVMWYGAYDGRHTLAIATSPDGVRWTKGNDGKSLTGLSGREQLGPSVYFDGRQYFLFYNRTLDNSWTTYAAVSKNGIDWQPANDGQPILGPPPKGNFGTAGPGRNHSVHPAQFVFHDKKVRVWYGAEDGSPPHYQRIGLMEADLSIAKAEPLQGDGARKLTSAERRVVAEGAAWGVITSLSDGSLGLVVQRARPLKEIDACNVAMEWLRSTDAGKSWSKPVLIAERRAADGQLYEKRTDGGYIVFQERNQALGQLPSGRIICAFCELNYHYDKNGKAEPRPGVAFNHENQGIVYTWSDDLGKTWSKTRKMAISPFGGKPPMVSPHWRIVTLKGGAALMSIYGSFDPQYKGQLKIPEGTHVMCGVLRSTDNGETWGDPSLIMTKTDKLAWEETALSLAGGKLLAHVRTGQHNVAQYVSRDQGRTWKGPTPVTEPGQQPGGAFRLKSGNLLFTWGNRRAPFGAMAMLSRDEGQTWDYQQRVSLGWDAANANCGYANGAVAGNGTVVVVYYAMAASTSYRNLWSDSKVYTVRFTERQFLEAAGATAQQAPPGKTKAPAENTVATSFRGLADSTRPRLAWKATTVEEHKAWHKAFRAKMLELLGRMPQRVPLQVKWTEKQRFDKFTRHKLYIQTEKTYWCPVYYFVPHELRERAPAIVCLHGHDGVIPYLGEGRKPGEPRPVLARDFARFFAEHGYVTALPIVRGWNETAGYQDPYGGSVGRSCQNVTMNSLLLGMSPAALRCWDAMRVIDFLETQDAVDAQRIGVAGLSGGGTLSLYLPILDERVKLVMMAGVFSSYRNSFYAMNHCICNCLPGVMAYGEMSDVVALHAPRPVLLINGLKDKSAPSADARQGLEKLKRIYAFLGVPERIEADFFDGPHEWSNGKTLEFLAKYFRK